MDLPSYRVFVCTKQRHPNDSEGCCRRRGGLEIYQAFQDAIAQQQLENQVELRCSGCLDRCEAGAVAMVFQPKRYEPSWLPTKIQKKLVANKTWYGRLKPSDIPELVEHHLANGKPLKQRQL